MDLSDYLKQLREGEKNLKDPVFLRQRCAAMFPGVDFTLEVEDGHIVIDGLTKEQHQRFIDEIPTIAGLR